METLANITREIKIALQIAQENPSQAPVLAVVNAHQTKR